MPYVYDPNNDPNNPNNPAGQQIAGGASNVVGGGQMAGGGSQAGAQATSSDRFQNLSSYLKANEGSGFGQQFSGKVNEDVNKAQGAQQEGAAQFKNASDQGKTTYNQDLVNRAVSNPTQFVQNQNDVNAFGQQRDASYKGPQTFSDTQDAYNKAQGATQKAQNVASQAQNESGRFALLNNYFGKPQYNQGQKSLDNLLIQGDSQAQQGIQQARQNAQQAQQSFAQMQPQLNNYAAQNKAQTDAARNQTRQALGLDNQGNVVQGQGAIGQSQNEINAALTQRQQGLASETANLKKAENAKYLSNLDPQTLAAMGISPTQFSSIDLSNLSRYPGVSAPSVAEGYDFGVNPGTYSNYFNSNDLNASNVATQDQASKMKALEQLSNLGTPLLDYSQAGKYSTGNLDSFNSSQFMNDITARRGGFQNDINSYQQRWDPALDKFHSGGAIKFFDTAGAQNDLNSILSAYGLSPTSQRVS